MRGLDSFSSAFYLKKANNSNTQLHNKSPFPSPPYSSPFYPSFPHRCPSAFPSQHHPQPTPSDGRSLMPTYHIPHGTP